MSESKPTPRRPAWLILDQGGHAGRALVFDHRGRVLGSAARRLHTHTGDQVEQDGEAAVKGLKAAAQEAIAGADLSPGALSAAALVCQRASVMCWDRETGQALSPAISWQDTRGAEIFRDLPVSPGRLAQLTGLPPSAHYGAAKMAWCLRELPAVKAAARQGRLAMGPMAAFLLFRMVEGRPLRVGRSLAQRTLLFDIESGDWSRELLHAFGIDRSFLPECAPDRSGHGRLEIQGGAIPLDLCAGDQNTIVWVCGPPAPGAAFLNLGTGGFVLSPLPAGQRAGQGLLSSLVPGAGPNTGLPVLAAEGTINGAGSALDWLSSSQDRHQDRHPAELDLEPGWPRESDPVFVNTVGGLGSPWWRTDRRPRFVPGIPDGALAIRCVLESVAFLARRNLERLVPGGARPAELWLGGGLARNPMLRKMLADALDLPIRLAPGYRELSAQGAWACLSGNRPEQCAGKILEADSQGRVRAQARYCKWLETLEMVLADTAPEC